VINTEGYGHGGRGTEPAAGPGSVMSWGLGDFSSKKKTKKKGGVGKI